MASGPCSDLSALVTGKTVIVCCGSGGTGKTTVSAAIGLAGAEQGRKTCVVTIDPARRLADALGLEKLDNTPRLIAGDWSGELSAVMLDAKGTFDDLIVRYSQSSEQADRILQNRLYRNLTSALSGTQEYMAMEKLYELHSEGGFDLVVVDTPPTRHALDFVDAPRRLYSFLENRVFRLLLMPTRAYMKAMTLAANALLRTISRVAGSEIVEDAMAFFRAFEGMEEGFRDRARRVEDLLADPGTAFVLVVAPRGDSIDEGAFLRPTPGRKLHSCERNGREPSLLQLRARARHRRQVDCPGERRSVSDANSPSRAGLGTCRSTCLRRAPPQPR